MARNQPYGLPLLLAWFYLAFSLLAAACHSHETSEAKKKLFRGMFVFGTSVVDNGNNNYLKYTLGKANYLPYGIDFPLGPTGRFSNGKNVADVIGDLLGLPLLPPFGDPQAKGGRIVHGVNYGSGGSGILDDTGSFTGGVISLNDQITNFENATLPELGALLGQPQCTQLLEEYLFLVAAGNNDFGLNYFFQDDSSRPNLFDFVSNLTFTYASEIRRLYKAGARAFALLTVYPIGCSPYIKQAVNSQKCVQTVNQAVHFFNTQLITMVDELKQKLPGAKFSVVNTYKIIRDIIKDPIKRGFSNATGPCCELKEIASIGISCKEKGSVCEEREKYLFFDGQHNTQAVNEVIAAKAFGSNRPTEAYPVNLQRLALG